MKSECPVVRTEWIIRYKNMELQTPVKTFIQSTNSNMNTARRNKPTFRKL